MDAMTIALIVLLVAAIWAVVELALVLRRTRKSVSDVTESVNGVLDEVRPIVTKLDGVVDELAPASKRIDPLLDKATTTVDLLNVDLARVEGILSDVTTVTDTGARVSEAVSGAADAVATKVAGVVDKVTGKLGGATPQEALAQGSSDKSAQIDHSYPEQDVSVKHVSGDAGYFTYPEQDSSHQQTAQTTSSTGATIPSEQSASPSTDTTTKE